MPGAHMYMMIWSTVTHVGTGTSLSVSVSLEQFPAEGEQWNCNKCFKWLFYCIVTQGWCNGGGGASGALVPPPHPQFSTWNLDVVTMISKAHFGSLELVCSILLPYLCIMHSYKNFPCFQQIASHASLPRSYFCSAASVLTYKCAITEMILVYDLNALWRCQIL